MVTACIRAVTLSAFRRRELMRVLQMIQEGLPKTTGLDCIGHSEINLCDQCEYVDMSQRFVASGVVSVGGTLDARQNGQYVGRINSSALWIAPQYIGGGERWVRQC